MTRSDNSNTIVSTSPEETRQVAEELVMKLSEPTVLALYGDLGSGKTCFVQGIAAALGITRIITSPTFTLVNEYRAQQSLIHIDLYRITDPDELLSLGFDEYLEPSGITAIEWAERAGDLIPESAISIHFNALPEHNSRAIQIITP